MKINKDLVDATMMLSIISLVLVWTSDFSNLPLKTGIMVVLAIIAGLMAVCRVLAAKQS